MRRTHDAHVNRNRLVSAESLNSSFFQAHAVASPARWSSCRRSHRETKCRRLPVQTSLPVALQRPVNAPFSWPNSSDSMSSEGKCRAIYCHKGSIAAHAVALVKFARYQFFSGARFTTHEHSRISLRDLSIMARTFCIASELPMSAPRCERSTSMRRRSE